MPTPVASKETKAEESLLVIISGSRNIVPQNGGEGVGSGGVTIGEIKGTHTINLRLDR